MLHSPAADPSIGAASETGPLRLRCAWCIGDPPSRTEPLAQPGRIVRVRMKLTALLAGIALLSVTGAARADCVILLHGLARTSASMEKLAAAFAERGRSAVSRV